MNSTENKTKTGAANRIFIAGCVSVGIGVFASPKLFDPVTQELIALAGLMMAGVLPTLMLTATVLRAGRLPVRRIAEYREALIKQAEVWAGLFVLALSSAAFVILGKVWAWRFWDTPGRSISHLDEGLGHIVTAIVAFLITFLVLRSRSVFIGIISLIELSAEIAIGEAQQRVEIEAREAVRGLKTSQPESYAGYIDLPH